MDSFSQTSFGLESNAVLYRFAAKHLQRLDLSRFHMATFDPHSSSAYQVLLQHPVAALPQPHKAFSAPRSRAGKRPIVVAVLGHQQPPKGYHWMPEVAQMLLQAHDDISLLLHNSEPDKMIETQKALRNLAARNPRLILDERVAGPAHWSELLDASDLILCPYGVSYALGRSAVVGDALANGIPAVVPANTAPARLVNEFSDSGTAFERWEPGSIMEATTKALNHFDEIARRAHAAAHKWPEIHGPARLVDAMLALAGRCPDGSPRPAGAPAPAGAHAPPRFRIASSLS